MRRDQLYLSTIAADSDTVARESGLGLEIAEYCTAYNMDDHFAETDTAVQGKLADIPRRILHAPFNELFPCAIDPLARKIARYRYLQAITLAHDYGAEKIVIHGGYNPKIYYPCWYTEQSIIFWKEFLAELARHEALLNGLTETPPDTVCPKSSDPDRPIQICLENVLEENPEMLLDIVKGINDPRLRICLDVGHVNAYSPVPVSDWLKTLAPWIEHFHLHNNTGEYDSHNGLDDGRIDMAGLLQEAEYLCPEATYTLEVMEAAPSVRWLKTQGLIED